MGKLEPLAGVLAEFIRVRRFRRRAGIAGVLVVLALTGCSTQPAATEKADTPQQTQQKLVDLLDRTQDQFEGTWENHDSPSPDPCKLPGSEEEGVTFTGSRSYTGARPDDSGINELIRFFKREGFDAGRGEVGPFVEVLAVHPLNKSLYVRVSMGTKTASVSGQAACVPGDAYEELLRLRKEQGSGN